MHAAPDAWGSSVWVKKALHPLHLFYPSSSDEQEILLFICVNCCAHLRTPLLQREDEEVLHLHAI
jgi:hypothetical protein